MTTFRIGAHTHSLVFAKILKYVIPKAILEYNRNDNLVTHINQHAASLLGKADCDDHLTLLFPSALFGMAA